jgi:hypothetical protein
LGIRIEEDHISRHPFLSQRFCDISRLRQEVKSNVLDSVALFLWEEFHHGFGRRTATGSPYFLPPLRVLEQHTHGVEARYAICTSHYGSQVLDAVVKGWKIAEDALVLQRQAFGTHFDQSGLVEAVKLGNGNEERDLRIFAGGNLTHGCLSSRSLHHLLALVFIAIEPRKE